MSPKNRWVVHQEKIDISYIRVKRITNYEYRTKKVVFFNIEATMIKRNDTEMMIGFRCFSLRDDETELFIQNRVTPFKFSFEVGGKGFIVVLVSDSIELNAIVAPRIAVRLSLRTEQFSNLFQGWLLE